MQFYTQRFTQPFKRLIPHLLLILVVFVAAACGQTKQAAAPSSSPAAAAPKLETTALTIGSGRDPQLSPLLIIAKEQGYFQKEGLTVDLKLFAAGPDVVSAIASKSIQYGSTGDIPPLIAKASGLPLQAIAQHSDISGVQTLVVNPDKIKKPADLKGKKVAYVSGTASEAFFLKIVEKYGIDVSSIQAYKVGPTEILPAFQKKDIDAFVIWQPIAAKGVKEAGGLPLLTATQSYVPGEEGPQALFASYSLLVGHKDFLDKNPETTKALLRALRQAAAYIKSNPDESAAYVSKTLDTEVDSIKSIFKLNKYALDITPQVVDSLASISNFLLKNEKIKAVPDLKEFIQTSYLKAVDPALVTWTP
ncbi:sulfonate ABC transporter substrate-binding protein [Paenibacillus marchantiophytorum]|uniref:Sulfonate ABC transporter substrate-binding protein n=1 Tax=Paenibacillus marchantiophytorum TaxID=1619310 RepID=A0ABQ2BNH9_9BACL|nr:ABC transporter substrate-binding protein [Paenibacillus marchantiophytorum]GGI43840.1 sulfonate ABC transporter substrate-binding protein [Paenibacillus marchantiophytorum]